MKLPGLFFRKQFTWEELERDWPDLAQLLGGYLHQDWEIEGDTPDAALRKAREEYGSTDDLDRVIEQLGALIASSHDDWTLLTMVERMTAGYSPELDGWTTRAWLAHAKALLEGRE